MNYRNKGGCVAEIGIKIYGFSKQNKGDGKILLSMLIYSLYNDLGYKRIILDTDLKNERAPHVYDQLGFKKLRINELRGQIKLVNYYRLLIMNYTNRTFTITPNEQIA